MPPAKHDGHVVARTTAPNGRVHGLANVAREVDQKVERLGPAGWQERSVGLRSLRSICATTQSRPGAVARGVIAAASHRNIHPVSGRGTGRERRISSAQVEAATISAAASPPPSSTTWRLGTAPLGPGIVRNSNQEEP
jgi:hypothetical protein